MSSEETKLPSPWWADSDGEAKWLRRHDANNQDELFWANDEGATYLNTLEDQRRLVEEAVKLLAEEHESYPSGRAMGPEKTDWLFRVAAFLSKLAKGWQTDE